jgi:anti-sigma factor RsiW
MTRFQPDCRRLVDRLADLVSGGLPPGDQRAGEAHLAACPACRRYLSTYLEAIRLAKAAFSRETIASSAGPAWPCGAAATPARAGRP